MKWFLSKTPPKTPPPPERSALAALMGPLSGRQRHDLSVIHRLCGPFSSETAANLTAVIQTLTTSTPPVAARRGLSVDATLSGLMAATALYPHGDVERMVMAAQVIRALDLEREIAGELLVYAANPRLPRTLFHHLLYQLLGLGGDAIPIVEAVLLGLASGAIRAQVRGAQVYAIDATTWLLAHPRTLTLALPQRGDDAAGLAHAALRAVGLASVVLPVTVTTEQGSATFHGFLSRADVWRDYVTATGSRFGRIDAWFEAALPFQFALEFAFQSPWPFKSADQASEALCRVGASRVADPAHPTP
jgi:hypothetical protein